MVLCTAVQCGTTVWTNTPLHTHSQQIFNMFNARKINDELFIYSGLHKSLLFWIMTACMLAGQVLIIFFLGEWFSARRQTWQEWVFAVGVGAGCQLWGLLIKLVTRCVGGKAKKEGTGKSAIRGVGMLLPCTCCFAHCLWCTYLYHIYLHQIHKLRFPKTYQPINKHPGWS